MLKSELKKRFYIEQEKAGSLLNALTTALLNFAKMEEDRDSVLIVSIHRQRTIEALEVKVRAKDKEIARLEFCLKEAEEDATLRFNESQEERIMFAKAIGSIRDITALSAVALDLTIIEDDRE